MARKDQKKQKKETRPERNLKHLNQATTRLYGSFLGQVLRHVRFVIRRGEAGDPEIASVDPSQGVIWLNPHTKSDISEAEWSFIIAHELLHLGLSHETRRLDREPRLWNLACDHAADNFVHAFKLGRPPLGFGVEPAFAGMREEELYEMLAQDGKALENFRTYAGLDRLDIVHRPVIEQRSYGRTAPRSDWETLLAEGIRMSVEEAVQEAAETLGQAEIERAKVWHPGEVARRWVMSEFPLLGAVASQMKIIADEKLCERLDIGVAAVDAYLGEIYFHPHRVLNREELIFVYVHELLHAALLHHTRGRGRDPWLWNVACDFVINDWLIEMGVGRFPSVGGLYDPRLKGMSSDEVYDLLMREPGRAKNARGFRGALGDVLFDSPARRIYRGDADTMDDIYKRCMTMGMSVMEKGRGTIPAGLREEIQSLFTPPVPWDVELARWMEAHVPMLREALRTYARASRRQASTPDIPRPARHIPQEWRDASTFGVVLDTSGSMDRELLGRALGAIASYAEARDVPRVRLVLCDAEPYDQGFVMPTDLRGIFAIKGRGGTVLQPAINYLQRQSDFPSNAPLMIITDGWCEEELLVTRDHCFVLPRKDGKEPKMPLRTSAPIFRVLKEEHFGYCAGSVY